MNRGKGFARGTEALARKKAKAKRPKPLLPKRITKSAVDSGPIRDRAHMARVAQQHCLICGLPHPQVHHLRECYPRTMGVRVGDDKTAPLCPTHHAELHMSNNVSFWLRYGIDAKRWAQNFYSETLRSRQREETAAPSGHRMMP